MNALQYALIHLQRKKTSTAICLISITLTVLITSLIWRTTLFELGRFSTMAETGDSVVGAKDDSTSILLGALNFEGTYPGFIPLELFYGLRDHQPEIKKMVPVLISSRFYQHRVISTDSSFFDRAPYEAPLTLESGQYPTSLGEVLVGANIAGNYHLKISDTLPLTPWLGDKTPKGQRPVFVKIVGILRPTSLSFDNLLYTNLEQGLSIARGFLGNQSDSWHGNVLNYFYLYSMAGKKDFLKKFINQKTVAQFINIADEKEKLKELTQSFEKLSVLMALGILSLGALSLFMAFVNRFENLGHEMTILLTIGKSFRYIFDWLLLEAVILCLIGIFSGAVLDYFFFPIFNQYLANFIPNSELISVPFYQNYPIWGVIFLTVVLGTFAPLLKAARSKKRLQIFAL